MLLINVDLPDPDTPVTQVMIPRGKSSVTSFRLLPVAPDRVSAFPLPLLRCFGMAISRVPLRYCPVSESGLLMICCGVPWPITLMQADGGFVKNVHDAYQPGADLACQANTLRFTPGEGIGTSFKREVFQPDVHQELKALPHFLQNFFGYLTFSTR